MCERKRDSVEDLFQMDCIFHDLRSKFGMRAFLVPTRNDKTREDGDSHCDWADGVVRFIYGVNRRKLDTAIHFSFIYFVEDKTGKVWGFAAGKSSFKYSNVSDIQGVFKDIDQSNETEEWAKFLCDNGLHWYKDEVLIFTNNNPNDKKEAFRNEQMLCDIYHLFLTKNG